MEATCEAREKVWREWTDYCDDLEVPPYLDKVDFRDVARVSTMFGGRIRKGKRGRAVGAGHVRAGLGHVNTQIALDTGRQPLHQRDGQHYIKPIQHMLAGFKNFDPAVEQKLACHPDLPDFACDFGLREGATQQQQATGDLVLIAFYYLLRVGEYTTKTHRGKKRGSARGRASSAPRT